jgi:hypothetical protein
LEGNIMSRVLFGLSLIALLALSACGSSGLLPQSSLTLRHATTNALISTSKNTGSFNLTVGAQLPLLVIRTFTDDNGSTDSQDVTQFANFKWASGSGVAAVDAFGNVTAVQAGQAQLEVKFRQSIFDPWDTVLLDLVVN